MEDIKLTTKQLLSLLNENNRAYLEGKIIEMISTGALRKNEDPITTEIRCYGGGGFTDVRVEFEFADDGRMYIYYITLDKHRQPRLDKSVSLSQSQEMEEVAKDLILSLQDL